MRNWDPERPLVCVILRTYEKHAPYLYRSIGSVLAQDLDPAQMELIIASDGKPSEDTEALIESLVEDAKFLVRIVSVDHTGYYCVPTNAAILETVAPFIATLDADNAWKPNHLSGLLTAITTPDPKLWLPAFVYSRREYHRDPGAPEGLPTGPSPLFEWNVENLVRLTESPTANGIDSSDLLISRSTFYILAELTGSMWNPQQRRFGDWELVARMAELGLRGRAVDQITLDYYWTADNLQHTRKPTEIEVMPASMYHRLLAEIDRG